MMTSSMELYKEKPEATKRFLSALAEALKLSRVDTLVDEPGLQDVRVDIADFVAQHEAGTSIGQCLEPWLGAWSSLGDLAAEFGGLKEWLAAASRSLAVAPTGTAFVPISLLALMRAGVPLDRSLPVLARLIEGPESERAVAEQLAAGASMTTVVKDWDAYTKPLVDWLEVAEGRGEIEAFHELLVQYLLEHRLAWPVDGTWGVPSMLVNTQLLIGLGLSLGRSLEQLMAELPAHIDGAPWWSEVQVSFQRCGSLATAYAEAKVIMPLGRAIIEQAELAGNVADALITCVALIRNGILIKLPELPGASAIPAAEEMQADDPEALEQWVESISIRGRMAYALLCIEAICRTWDVESQKFRGILDSLWEFTSSMRLDEWEMNAQGRGLFEDDYYEQYLEENKWLGVVKGWGLSDTNDGRAEALVRLIGAAMAIGMGNLYSGYESFRTADPLKNIINIFQVFHINLPDRGRVSLSRSDERDGWGDPHPPEFYR